MSVVFTNGCFDGLLHAGHMNLLLYCSMLAGPEGDVFVGIDSDQKVIKDKGSGKPLFSQRERMDSVLSLGNNYLFDRYGKLPLVTNAFFFNTNQELYELISNLRPDYIVKGSEWKDNVIGSDIAQVRHYPVDKKYSTSNIIERVCDKVFPLRYVDASDFFSTKTYCTCTLNPDGTHNDSCYDKRQGRVK